MKPPFETSVFGTPGYERGWSLPGPVERLFPGECVKLGSPIGHIIYTKQCSTCGALIPHNAQTQHYWYHEEQQ